MNMPNMIPVESSAIRKIGYDPATQRLFVEFPSGSVWAYNEVSVDDFNALRSAESVGKHFGQHVRGKFVGAALPRETQDADSEGGEP